MAVATNVHTSMLGVIQVCVRRSKQKNLAHQDPQSRKREQKTEMQLSLPTKIKD